MVTLFCAIVGVAGSAFEVKIDDTESVSALKKAIKAENPATITCDAKDLHLFLAKKGDAWLPDDDPAALALDNGVTHLDVQGMIDGEQMKATWTLEDVLTANNMTKPKSRQIHVLVMAPEQRAGGGSGARTSASVASQDGVFDHCSNPFFLQFPTVDQGGDWLEFSSLLPLTKRQALYIRSSRCSSTMSCGD
ncbi:unnamed protein product [Phytophthora lilii]|uniref:Unnamed protein product n=1 Tax=Phytophthora lilii TaxID=2077276 RepID=A0A9W7CNY6_9STRA|nr:unnamed protein product [Phytophthora lilii]